MRSSRFQVGANYENEKGLFKVLAIRGEEMVIEWDSGERIRTTCALQERILARMEKATAALATSANGRSTTGLGKSFAGFSAGDFSDNVAGTHWRSREQLGGAVTRLIESREPFNSWSIYQRSEIHWAASNRYRSDPTWLQAKFFIRLNSEVGMYGYYIERSNDPKDSRSDWLSFLNWLNFEDHVNWLHALFSTLGVRMFDPYPDLEVAFNRTIDADENGWMITGPGRPIEWLAIPALPDYLAEIDDNNWLNLMIGTNIPSSDLLSRGTAIAADIAKCFNALMPIYWNRSSENTPARG